MSKSGIIIIAPFYVIINVNDILMSGESTNEAKMIKKFLSKKFDMKDLNDLHYFLGIEVIQILHEFLLSQ